jgi:hypothetical protein
MSEKCIVVNSSGKGASATVTEKSNVNLSTVAELDDVIGAGLLEVANILSGDVADPTKKRCSSCAKKGRMPYHPVTNFSTLKNGKLLSQCKVCRTEQSDAWCKRRAEHRKAYHKAYQKVRQPAVRQPAALKEFIAAMQGQANDTAGINGGEALFVAMPTEDVETT